MIFNNYKVRLNKTKIRFKIKTNYDHAHNLYTFIYRAAFDAPIRLTEPVFTIAPNTASTVVGLTSGSILQISALESGVRLFNTVASIRAFFVIRFPLTTANRLSSSL